MSEAKHTRGPWRAAIGEDFRRSADEDRLEICCLPHPSYDAIEVFCQERTGDCTLEELDANARLIAAAPELLEACKRAHNSMVEGFEENTDIEEQRAWEHEQIESIKQLAAAIAKAEDQTCDKQEATT